MAEAQISIGRYTSNQKEFDNLIYIEITDVISGVKFVTVTMLPEDFAMALTGRGMINGEMTLRGIENVGKQFEMKTEIVQVDDGVIRYEQAVTLAEPFEVDGWKHTLSKSSRIEATRNDDKMLLKLSFARYVDAK